MYGIDEEDAPFFLNALITHTRFSGFKQAGSRLLTMHKIRCLVGALVKNGYIREGPSWQVEILSTVPTVDWALLGSGESNKG